MSQTRLDNSQVLDSDFALQAELDAMTLKTVVAYNFVSPLAVSVTAGLNYATLTGSSKPTHNISTVYPNLGALAARLSVVVGSHQTTALLDRANLCLVRLAGTDEVIFTGGAKVYALLQVGVSATDGVAFSDSGNNQGQLSFVYWNPGTQSFIACPSADIGGKTIEFIYPIRTTELSKSESSFVDFSLTNGEDASGRNYQSSTNTTAAAGNNQWQSKGTLTVVTNRAGVYRVRFDIAGRPSTATARLFSVRLVVDTAAQTQRDFVTAPLQTADTQYSDIYTFNLTAGTHTIEYQYNSANNCSFRKGFVEIWRAY